MFLEQLFLCIVIVAKENNNTEFKLYSYHNFLSATSQNYWIIGRDTR